MVMGKTQWYLLIVTLCACAISGIGAFMPFILDDFAILDAVAQNLVIPYTARHFISFIISGHFAQFMPLRSLLDWLTYVHFGTHSAVPYHLLLAAFHAVVAVCAFFFAQKLTSSRSLAFISALVFTLLPYHFMSIWWVANIGNPMTFFFFLFGFFTFSKWIEGGRDLLIIWSLLWLNASFLSSYQGALYPLALVVYLWLYRERIKKSLTTIVGYMILLLLFDYLCFAQRSNYASGRESLLVTVGSNLTTFWSRLLMADVFTSPQMPLSQIAPWLWLAGITLMLVCDMLQRHSRLRMAAIVLASLVGMAVARYKGWEGLTRYASLVFFCYYAIFGDRIQRFLVGCLVVFSGVFLTTAFFTDRYLYSPSLPLVILVVYSINSYLRKSGLSLKGRAIAAGTLLCGFMMMSAVFYYDKFWDWFSVTHIQWNAVKDAAACAPAYAKVVPVNSSNLFFLHVPLRQWPARPDIEIGAGFGVVNDGFFLGDGYFINFNHLRRAAADSRFIYEAAAQRQLQTPRVDAFVYDRIRRVRFFDRQAPEGFSLAAGNQLNGLVVNRYAEAIVRLVYEQASGAGGQGGMSVEIDGHQLPQLGVRTLEKGRLQCDFLLPQAPEPMKLTLRSTRGVPLRLYTLEYCPGRITR